MVDEAEATDIFISYARADVSGAERLQAMLEGAPFGYSVWRDKTRLRPGEHVDRAIPPALKACRAVVVLWSDNSVGSEWVKKEAGYADVEGKIATLSLGGFDYARLPTTFRPLNCLDLEAVLREPALLVERLEEIWRERAEVPEPKLRPAMVPYTIDCRPQVKSLRNGIAEFCGIETGTTGTRPLFALHALHEDSPELLVVRLVQHDMPAMPFRRALVGDPEDLLVPVQWPPAGRGRAKKLRDTILKLAKDRGHRGRRISIHRTIVRDPAREDALLVEDWLDAWHAALGPEDGAIPFLVIVEPAAEWRWPWSRANPHIEPMLEAVRRFERPGTRGVELQPLEPIGVDDTHTWNVRHNKSIRTVVPADRLDTLIRFVDDQFENGAWKSTSPRLGQFASAVSKFLLQSDGS